MPFKSEKQRKHFWATNPELARKWADKEKSKQKEAGALPILGGMAAGAAAGGAYGASKGKSTRQKVTKGLKGSLLGAAAGGTVGAIPGMAKVYRAVRRATSGGGGAGYRYSRSSNYTTGWRAGFKDHGVAKSNIKTRKDWKKAKRGIQTKYHPDKFSQKPKAEQDIAAEKFKDWMEHAADFENSRTFKKMAFFFSKKKKTKKIRTRTAAKNPKHRKTYADASKHMHGKGFRGLTALGVGLAAADAAKDVGALLALRKFKGLGATLAATQAAFPAVVGLGAAGLSAHLLDSAWDDDDKSKGVHTKLKADRGITKSDSRFLRNTLESAQQDTANGALSILGGAGALGVAAASHIGPKLFPMLPAKSWGYKAGLGLMGLEGIRSGIEGLRNQKRYSSLLRRTSDEL